MGEGKKSLVKVIKVPLKISVLYLDWGGGYTGGYSDQNTTTDF